MGLARFIRENLELIVVEFAGFAGTLVRPERAMSEILLRDHAHEILLAIASDMESAQSEPERRTKSRGHADLTPTRETSAAAHGALRQQHGFDLKQVAAEFRALRAAVLRRWQESGHAFDAGGFDDMTRFNEGIDQAVADSVMAYSAAMAESREMFLAMLGHDLRSPLGALAGCLHLLSTFDPEPPQREKAFAIATRSVANIEMMVTDLLEYTRTRLGRGMEIVAVVGDLGAVCKDTFEEVRAAHPARLLELAISGDVVVAFDGPRMRQMLTNLLGNAVQHGDPAHAVRLDVAGGDAVVLTVTNRGLPIPAAALQTIFDPLVQVARHETMAGERPSTSMGLGLFIAREIVHAHGADISVSSSAERGTAFVVRMKREAAALA